MDEKAIQEFKLYLERKKAELIEIYIRVKAKTDFEFSLRQVELKAKIELVDTFIIDLMFKEKRLKEMEFKDENGRF